MRNITDRRASLAARGTLRARGPRAFTLIEVLLIVVLLGIAGVMVIPSMSQAGVLRVQAAVRTVVSDISFMQSEAVAFQSRRAIWFGKVAVWNTDDARWDFVDGNGYVMCEVTGPDLVLSSNALPDPDRPDRPFFRDLSNADFGDAALDDADFNDGDILIFDELGGPVAELDGPDPGNGGTVRLTGSGSSFALTVQAYTGRVVVQRTEAP